MPNIRVDSEEAGVMRNQVLGSALFLAVLLSCGCATQESLHMSADTDPSGARVYAQGEGPARHVTAASRTYTNPLSGPRTGDPFVLRQDDLYYLVGYGDEGNFACWTSPDLVHRTSAGLALAFTSDSWAWRNFWAPEITRYRDRFYVVYSAKGGDDQRFHLCLAVADAPGGPYADLRTPYVFFTRVGVEPNPPGSSRERHLYGITYGARLSEDLSAIVEGPALCVQADQPWELVEKDFVLCNEGPFVFRRGDRYYMTYSSGHYASPPYGIGYATATSPLGPWTKSPSNPLVASDPAAGVSGPGHSSITTSPDGTELFMVYHAHADPQNPSGNRTVNIDRLTVEPDGALRLIGPTRTPQPIPSGAP